MSRTLIATPVSPASVLDLLPGLTAALSGTGPALAPIDADGPRSGSRPGPIGESRSEVADDVALVVRTSGSTGEARAVMLTVAALRASAQATAQVLGRGAVFPAGDPGTGEAGTSTAIGSAQWLLALPPVHIAGLQVLVRSILSGTVPSLVDLTGGFRPAAFVTASRAMDGDLRYTSLVPTQLRRLLADPVGLSALLTFDAVLLGGAATPVVLLDDARDKGVRVVTTYGMTETCGGCVYDGLPLPGVEARLDDGRILLAGPMLAAGYLGRPDLDEATFVVEGGVRWLRTSDLGVLSTADAKGARAGHALTLHVVGRIDDVIVTGGVKVAPAAVEQVLVGVDAVLDAAVVGLPDDEWGQSVTAVVVLRPGAPVPSLPVLRELVTRALGAASAPRHLVVTDSLPLRGPGKTDRRAVAQLALDLLAH